MIRALDHTRPVQPLKYYYRSYSSLIDKETAMRKHFLLHNIICILVIALSPLFAAFFSMQVRAGTVLPSGTISNADVNAIDDELDQTGYVRLRSGSRYYLSHFIPVNSNSTIDARGATIIVRKGAVRNDPMNYRTGYDSMSKVTIIGGTWLSADKNGCTGTTFSFAHASNITLKDMNIRSTNAEGHAIELVACKNISIRNCTVIAQGKGRRTSVEEMIQVDLASPHNAPFLEEKYQNGLACQNVTISGCRVTGNRAIGVSFSKKDKQYLKKYHTNITVKNCRLTGNTAEGLALFNAINVTVKNNRIISKSSRTNTAYSSGCHVTLFGKIPAFASGKISIRNNVIKGGRTGFQICSHSKVRYGTLIIKKNKLYSKKGKKRALVIELNPKGKASAKKIKDSRNKKRKWK